MEHETKSLKSSNECVWALREGPADDEAVNEERKGSIDGCGTEGEAGDV